MKQTHRPKKNAKSTKNNKKNKSSKSLKPDSTEDTFDLGDGLTLLNPMTEGLGFKDKVSDGVYTMEMEHNFEVASADAGTLNIGNDHMGDGVLNISGDGVINLQSIDEAPPALFHSGHDGLIKKTAKKSGESFFGALIDVLLLSAFSIFTAAAVTEFSTYTFDFELMFAGGVVEMGKMFLIFGAYFLSYKILARVFYGRTLGEWSSRHQLGLKKQQLSTVYPLRVLARELGCLLTGVFMFPLVSSVIRRDVGYYISGLQTYVEQKTR